MNTNQKEMLEVILIFIGFFGGIGILKLMFW